MFEEDIFTNKRIHIILGWIAVIVEKNLKLECLLHKLWISQNN